MNYYNDNDPKAAAWLRELIKQNLIPAGDVDERSIEDVTKSDLKGYTQCHFFAGIGGWSEALRLAGWPADRPVWTGSCPCQPFSSAGKRQGEKDKRHLWPEFFRLIRECKPNVIFGEQVERAIGMGWLDRVFADLEVEGYACGAAVLGAHSVGAPHIRQRLYWVADTNGKQINATNQERLYTKPGGGGGNGRVADTTGGQRQQREGPQGNLLQRSTDNSTNGGLGDSELHGSSSVKQPRGAEEKRRMLQSEGPSAFNFWSDAIWIPCKDGKTRRISSEPAFFPLVDGIPGRVAMLRGFGNAIVPQVAAEFIKAYEECDK